MSQAFDAGSIAAEMRLKTTDWERGVRMGKADMADLTKRAGGVGGAFGGMAKQIAACLRSALMAVPGPIRSGILAHWRLMDWSPRLIMMPMGETKAGAFPFAVVDLSGHALLANSTWLNRMPDDLVVEILIHELAHVVQWASGSKTMFQPHGDPMETEAAWIVGQMFHRDPDRLGRMLEKFLNRNRRVRVLRERAQKALAAKSA